MSYWVEKGIVEIEGWEQRVLEFLSEHLPSEAIVYYLEKYDQDIRGLYELAKKGEGIFSLSIYDAISSLSQLRSLKSELSHPFLDAVPVEVAARFAVLCFRAGIVTGMIRPALKVEELENDLAISEKEYEEKLQHAGKEAISESAAKSVNYRHAPLRELKEKVAETAKTLWQNGSDLLHHKMATYLVEEYEENGRHPFTRMPGVKDENTIKTVREVTKQVAKEMGRPDLIYNHFREK